MQCKVGQHEHTQKGLRLLCQLSDTLLAGTSFLYGGGSVFQMSSRSQKNLCRICQSSLAALLDGGCPTPWKIFGPGNNRAIEPA